MYKYNPIISDLLQRRIDLVVNKDDRAQIEEITASANAPCF